MLHITLDPSYEAGIFIFFNRARNKIKILGHHRNGMVLVYKVLDKQKFSIKSTDAAYYSLTENELSWLLAGLDWVNMSACDELVYEDYF